MVAQDCARAYRTNAILTASPGQLVLMLYDGALNAMATARAAFERPARDTRRYEIINRQIAKARNILAELQGRLDFGPNQELAETLYRLYDYYNRRLMQANLEKSVEPIQEVEQLLGQLRDAWSEMLAGKAGVQPALV